MLILPAPYQPKVLMPVPVQQWRTPSLAQPKDQFGNENCTRFRITARLHDGHIVWRGWFDDRDDADAFFTAIIRASVLGDPVPRELWDLPSPGWQPGMGELLEYDFATLVFLTTTTGSNQTYTSLADWNNLSNKIETIGAGGGGGRITSGSGRHATGGGGGAWNKVVNFSFATPGTTTATYQLGTAGTGGASATDGGDSWFNATTLAGSSVGSKGGAKGKSDTAASTAGGIGGLGASGIGTSSHDGGDGGAATGSGTTTATGGGGAAGSSGDGNDGGASSSASPSAGGSGDAGSGGSAGAGGSPGVDGGAGAEWDPSHGSGGGGGGGSTGNGGNGGNYGAASGGATSGVTAFNAAQGIVVLTYTPVVNSPGWLALF